MATTAPRPGLPQGGTLAPEVFEHRHRLLQVVLAVHVPGLLAFALARGIDPVHAAAASIAVPAVCLAASAWAGGRRVRAVFVTAGLLWCSTTLAYAAGGSVEARFHVFVVLAAISLYQDWVPFGFTVIYAVLSDGLSGRLGAGALFGTGTAEQRHPWTWAAVEGAAILGAALAQLVAWKQSEVERSRSASLAADLTRLEDTAERRRVVGHLLVSLARRNQALLERQLELVDELEARESDPTALAELFRLDHLATRMRRNAENLLVLASNEPLRRWREPLAASEVARGAIAEVEEYTRVDVSVAEDPTVVGHAVADVAHLLAELIENATAFSPPESRIVVRGSLGDGGYELRVEDRGIGMAPAERAAWNERLTGPPDLDVDQFHTLGLHVVARLAARHGVTVRLEAGDPVGTTAVVGLPATLLQDRRARGAPTGSGDESAPPHLPAAAAAPPAVPLPADAAADPPGRHLISPPAWLPPPPVPAPVPGQPPQAPDVPHLGATGAGRTIGHAAGAAAARAEAERRFRGADPRAAKVGGLAQRVPRSHLAPGIAGPPPLAARRGRPDPDSIRDRLGRYQQGVEGGRRSVGGARDDVDATGDAAPPDLPRVEDQP